jgi:hypothetical protein
MKDAAHNDEKAPWKPDKYLQILDNALDAYEKEHPHWQAEVLVSLIDWSLRSLKHYVDNEREPKISWGSPFVELHYPIDWNWDVAPVAESPDFARSGLHLGTISEQNTRDKKAAVKTLSEIMVRRLNTLALGDLTHDAWFEIKNDYQTPILPLELSKELAVIKGKRAKTVRFKQIVRPFSIGAATIDYSEMDFKDGEKVPKKVVKQLQNINQLIDIERIAIKGDVNGHEVETSIIFQIHPLIANYDQKKAYHPIIIGLFFEPHHVDGGFATDTPASWSTADREIFWSELFQEIEKLSDGLISKPERQASQIFQINAQLEIPVTLSGMGSKNVPLKEIIEKLSQAGHIREISVAPALPETEPARKLPEHTGSNETEKIPTTATEGMVRIIWKSRFRTPLIILLSLLCGLVVIFGILPEKIKLEFLKLLGIH